MLRRGKHDTDDRQPGRILVVNEDPDACELLCRVLTQAGYEVDRTHDQTSAVSFVTSSVPDVLILDLGDGGIGTNLTVLDSLRTHTDPAVAGVRVVLAAAQANNRMYSWQAGVDAFLVRPFHVDKLLDEIREVLNRPDEERARHRRQQLNEAKTEGRTIEPRTWETQRY
jgi:DNA-binding response OmpR family regulator